MPTVSTNAELMAALAVAVGGDRIELSAGDYGSLSINGVTFSSDVTIVSADPANPAIIHELNIVGGSSHLVFDGILFDFIAGQAAIDGATWSQPFSVRNSSYITIRNSVFDGDEVPSLTGPGDFGTGWGLLIVDSDNVVIENNKFFEFFNAIIMNTVTNITVRANDIHTISSDGLDLGIAVDGLLIEGNWFHGFKVDASGDAHTDMIQGMTVLGYAAPKNVTIRGNFLDAGTGDVTQSIFMRNEVVDQGQGSFEDYAYQNILIEDNVIYNAHIHGITVGATDGLVVRNNTLLFDSGAKAAWTAPRVLLTGSSLNVTVEDNISEDVVAIDGPMSASWVVGPHLSVQNDDPTGENYYGDLFVNPFAVGATLTDLRALPGGVVELGGYGAAMTRADIPLLVGPYATAPAPDPVPEPDVCEALLAEALAVVAELEAQLADAFVELEEIGTLLTAVEVELATTTTALATMTGERDAALAKLAAIFVIATP